MKIKKQSKFVYVTMPIVNSEGKLATDTSMIPQDLLNRYRSKLKNEFYKGKHVWMHPTKKRRVYRDVHLGYRTK